MNVVIYGCGENGLQAFHCLRHTPALKIVGFLDDDVSRWGASHLGLPVFGGSEIVTGLRADRGVEGVCVAIGDNAARRRHTQAMRARGLRMVSAVHPQVLIESPRRIGEGVIIEMGAALHPECEIGDGVFLGGGAHISHHSRVGEFSLIAGGVVFGGHVTLGPECLLGVGVSIKPHVTIGARVTIGVGAAVVTNLPDDVLAVGVPARIVKQTRREPSA